MKLSALLVAHYLKKRYDVVLSETFSPNPILRYPLTNPEPEMS